MQSTLEGRVVVITGASAGVGRAIATELGRQGAKVALLARGNAGLLAAREEIVALGSTALPIVTDVSESEQVESAADRVEAELGPIDVWINNAMVTVLSPATAMSADEYDRVTRVNYLGTVYGTLAALRRMRPRDQGHVIQIGSALSYRAIPLQSAYCASKYAIRGFTDSLRSELYHDRSSILLTMVQLPAVNTPQFDWCRTRLPERPQPVPPIYQPEVIARAVAGIIGKDRREVWIGGSAVKGIWGSRLASGMLDHYLGEKGYEGQQVDGEPEPPRADNLFHPLPGDHGAHGRFDDRAREYSIEAWFAVHRGAWVLGAVALGAAAAAAWVRRAA